jgi:oligopeptide/dipeptide ABC transporter ATP-binding protein
VLPQAQDDVIVSPAIEFQWRKPPPKRLLLEPVEGQPLLSVRDLHVQFRTDQGIVKAADGVSFDLAEDEVLGIVGESGSGKSVTALAILGLLPSTATVTGEVRFRGHSLLDLKKDDMRGLRGSSLAIVFQDALAALNPLHRIGHQIVEAIRVHDHKVSRKRALARAVELLGLVGIESPGTRVKQYPHELSGGMRQRALIAMAIANDPDVLIADEPTTALDVTTQAQVLEVLKAARSRTRSGMVIITHDLGVVSGVATRVLVMYAGKVVESGTVDEVFERSEHPYTLGLLRSRPRIEGGTVSRLERIAGQPPSLIDVPPGCAFHPRCRYAQLPEPCAADVPALRAVTDPAHVSACHFAGNLVETPQHEPPQITTVS